MYPLFISNPYQISFFTFVPYRRICFEKSLPPRSPDTGLNRRKAKDLRQSPRESIKSHISPFKPKKGSNCSRTNGQRTRKLRDRRKPNTASDSSVFHVRLQVLEIHLLLFNLCHYLPNTLCHQSQSHEPPPPGPHYLSSRRICLAHLIVLEFCAVVPFILDWFAHKDSLLLKT